MHSEIPRVSADCAGAAEIGARVSQRAQARGEQVQRGINPTQAQKYFAPPPARDVIIAAASSIRLGDNSFAGRGGARL
ncbi:tetratricopeptide repeat protein 14 [Platysternon megacephalum]|uniref:Tetratricopeptide repeat protein 14 n=1 Tax=Platysternon megacephalum TaxID=55544 RepID=A0A4D9E7Q0_9SAUR|nr:tetratricopeptide repeat protein 14 [Platysternon megacephalum]